MHKYEPNETVLVRRVLVAFDANVPPDQVADEMTALLTESGVSNPNSPVLDWQYRDWKSGGVERPVSAMFDGWAQDPASPQSQKTGPDGTVVIRDVELAFPDTANESEWLDELIRLLTDRGVENPDSAIVAWQLTPEKATIQLDKHPEEGDAFLGTLE